MSKFYHFTSLLAGAMLFVVTTSETCNSAQTPLPPCTHNATVKDYNGLDGCGILFLMENEKKLLPSNFDQFETQLEDGEQVRISYEADPDGMSICMAEDIIGRLTCLATHRTGEWTLQCPVMTDPFRSTWSAQVMQDIDPDIVEEMTINGNRTYRFHGKTENRIYSCTGKLLCGYTYISPGACDDLLSLAQDVRVIYVVNEEHHE